MAVTILTKLTSLNVQALQQAIDEGIVSEKDLKLSKTVAYAQKRPEEAHQLICEIKAELVKAHGSKGHPVASIHAVVRKSGYEARQSVVDRELRKGASFYDAHALGREAEKDLTKV